MDLRQGKRILIEILSALDPRAAVATDVALLRAIPALPGEWLFSVSSMTWRPDSLRLSYRQRGFARKLDHDEGYKTTNIS